MSNNAMKDWEQITQEFCSFGGKVRNVTCLKGKRGYGLFSIDPNKKSTIHVPEHLLVPCSDMSIHGERLVLQNSFKYPTGYDKWINKYMEKYSFSRFKKDLNEFNAKASKLNPELLRALRYHRILELKHENRSNKEVIQTASSFFQSRSVTHNKCLHLMPIIELINHDKDGGKYVAIHANQGGGIAISGHYPEEILIRYNDQDSLDRLRQYHFSSLENMAYSLDLSLNYHNKFIIEVQRPRKIEPTPTSALLSNKKLIVQPSLLLGSRLKEHAVRRLFSNSMRQFIEIDYDDVFNYIHRQNTKALIHILRLCNENQNSTVETIKNTILNQLETMSYN